MQVIATNCPSCGASYGGTVTGKYVTCEYCGTRFALSDDELAAMGVAGGDAGRGAVEIDTGSDPMYVFARDACARFLREADESSFESSAKVLKGLGIQSDDEVYLIHDDTMFKSGKNGFAITREGIYCREMGDRTAHFVSWADFGAASEPEVDDSYIKQGRKSVCYFTDDSDVLEGELFSLYRQLYIHARKMA